MIDSLFLILINLFSLIGELLIFAVRLAVFLVLSPWLIYKCAARGILHRSAAASWQMLTWVCAEYWILKK